MSFQFAGLIIHIIPKFIRTQCLSFFKTRTSSSAGYIAIAAWKMHAHFMLCQFCICVDEIPLDMHICEAVFV